MNELFSNEATMSAIAQNLERVRDDIASACDACGRSADEVTLVAVSKTVDVHDVREAYEAGQRQFGENRIQEWRKKSEILPDDIHWNIIGHLQTNKAKYIIGRDNLLLQSLDRMELVRTLEDLCVRREASVDALVQVNLSREHTKSGLYQEDLPQFLEDASECPHVRLRGLMTIGPNTDDERLIRKVFAQAKKIYDEIQPIMTDFCCLSMGMSNDFELAIREGSTMVRIGTAIFGARTYQI